MRTLSSQSPPVRIRSRHTPIHRRGAAAVDVDPGHEPELAAGALRVALELSRRSSLRPELRATAGRRIRWREGARRDLYLQRMTGRKRTEAVYQTTNLEHNRDRKYFTKADDAQLANVPSWAIIPGCRGMPKFRSLRPIDFLKIVQILSKPKQINRLRLPSFANALCSAVIPANLNERHL